MTKSYPSHFDADYTPRDMGPIEKPTREEEWDRHTPEWEGMSEEEKQEWLDNHPIL